MGYVQDLQKKAEAQATVGNLLMNEERHKMSI